MSIVCFFWDSRYLSRKTDGFCEDSGTTTDDVFMYRVLVVTANDREIREIAGCADPGTGENLCVSSSTSRAKETFGGGVALSISKARCAKCLPLNISQKLLTGLIRHIEIKLVQSGLVYDGGAADANFMSPCAPGQSDRKFLRRR